MKKFLIIWSLLTILITGYLFFTKNNSLFSARLRFCEISSISLDRPVLPKDINFEDGGDLDFFKNVLAPSIEFGVTFFGIPVALGCLITLALKKSS